MREALRRAVVAVASLLGGALQGITGRFIASGGIAAAVYFAASYALLSLGVTPFPAGLSAYGVAFLVGYTLQQFWTFSGRAPVRRSLPRYLVVQAGCALTSGLATMALTSWGAVPPFVTSAALTIALSGLSYLASLTWVFTGRMSGRD